MLSHNIVVRTVVIASLVLLCRLPLSAANNDAAVPARLDAIEALLKQVADALKPPPVAQQKTRLLIPFVSNQAGFDCGISIANTGRDSTGVIGKAGVCTIHYFGTMTGGGLAPAPQTTNAVIPPGGQLTFTVSSGGNFGIVGTP